MHSEFQKQPCLHAKPFQLLKKDKKTALSTVSDLMIDGFQCKRFILTEYMFQEITAKGNCD